MEKKVYKLTINETLEHVMPPLQELELILLTNSLLTEGCRDPLVVWNGMVVDGHNRYRICRENDIPFSYTEMDFENESAAKMWIIRTQLARRNVPDYRRCELVVPLEAELKAEAKKRQGWKRNDHVMPNLAEQKRTTTRDEMAKIAGVSHGTMDMVKKIVKEADEETKDKLRKGEISTFSAFKSLKEKETHTPKRSDLLPGYGLAKDLPPMKEGTYVRPPDSVYDIPPIEVYGNMPSDNMELRGNAEMIHARSDLQSSTDSYMRRVSDVLRGMSAASVNEENIQTLREIVTCAYDQIIDMFNRKLGGNLNEQA